MKPEIDVLSARQEQLIAGVEHAAAWRADKAQEHPEEARHEQSTTALSVLAPRLAALAPNDPRLRRIYKIEKVVLGRPEKPGRDARSSRFVEALTGERSAFFSRYGFGDPSETGADVGVFLLDLADLTTRCADEITKSGDPETAA